MTRIFLCFFLIHGMVFSGKTQPSGNTAEKLQVLLFMSPDCPICQKYMAKLNAIATDFSTEVTFQGIIPGTPKSKEIRQFIKEYGIKFSVKQDKDNHFVKLYQPMVTPEVVLLNGHGDIKYQGAIDDWFYELGKYRHAPENLYLLDAIRSVLAGKDPEIRRTEAIGCIIQADLKGDKMEMDHTKMHHQ